MDPMMNAPAAEPFPATEPTPAEMAPPAAIRRETPEVDPARAANVQRILANIQSAKAHWRSDFERMRRDMDFASGLQWYEQATYEDDRYRVNLVLRHIRQRVSALYAKNPKAIYKRKPMLDFVVWDERPETLLMAMQTVQMAQQMQAQAAAAGDPATMMQAAMAPMADPVMQAQAVLTDYQQGMDRRRRVERTGRSMELLWDWFVKEPIPNVKLQMKQMVRRAVTCGVGYMKLGFQRALGPRPDNATRIADLTQQLATIERLRAMVDDQGAQQHEADAEELRQALIALQQEPEVVLREGPVLDFPRATALIPDTRLRSLRGWIGAEWIAEEFELPASRVMEIYGVDLSTARAGAAKPGEAAASVPAVGVGPRTAERMVSFWQYYERTTGRLYTVAEGWPDYLEEPRAPEVKLERFFPYYALTFNDMEHEKRIFPPSDVELLRSPQEEYNRIRESLRQHRIANRPLYAAANGAFDEKDTHNLSGYPAHSVVTLNNLKEGQAVGELLQPVQKVPIDPNAYETNSIFEDVLRGSGSQEANLGGTSGATATESSVAEASRLSATSSDTDDIDEVLGELARDFGQVCLAEMSPEKVKEIVGPGAVWPVLSRAEIAAELELAVEAGSSGRPNRDRDLANFERAAPFIMQIPGIDPEALAKYALRLLDDRIDLTQFYRPGMPSITAMNSMAKPATGDPETEPTQQGERGNANAPSTNVRPGGPQPAYGPSGNFVG